VTLLTALERRYLNEVTNAVAARPTNIQQLEEFISTVGAIVGRLEDLNDLEVSALLRAPLEIFEEVYGVALDRGWAEVPAANLSVVKEAVEEVRHALQLLSGDARPEED
jgi:hypothetical protein